MKPTRTPVSTSPVAGTLADHRPRVVIGHPHLGRGGSEARVMWLIEALKRDHDITVTTTGGWDLAALNAHYGTEVRDDDVKVRIAPVPRVFRRSTVSALRGECMQRFANKIAGEYDVRISAYNPIDWGLPAIQFVSDFTWHRALRERLDPPTPGFFYKDTPLRRVYLRATREFGRPSDRPPLTNDCIIANSRWTSPLLLSACGVRCASVMYPSVWSRYAHVPWEEKEEAFVMIGRIAPEKQIERAIAILEAVRSRGHSVRLYLCGHVGRDIYGQRIADLCRDRADWISLEGQVGGAAKAKILASCRYGIHTREAEPFGISVAEMIKAGAIAFAGNDGGQTEIVDHPDLLFDSTEECVEKICNVLSNPNRQQELRAHLAVQSGEFTPARFMDAARSQVLVAYQRAGTTRVHSDRPTMVIGHPKMGHGGSEAAVMWLIEALKHNFDITIVTTGGWNLPILNAYYGTNVLEHEIKVRIAPMPRIARQLSVAALRGACFQRFARQIAADYDIRISAYNPTDWGLPAIHFIGDFSWHHGLRASLDEPTPGFIYRDTLIRKAYLRLADTYARPSNRVVVQEDRIVANSQWSSDLLVATFGAKAPTVIYPPVWTQFPDVPWELKEDAFAVIGRIAPEKQIEDIIAIIEEVRQRGHRIGLHLCGPIGDDPYGQLISKLCSDRSEWIVLEGKVSGTKKAEILSRCRYGIQARRSEPFGIAVCEMVKAGSIVFSANSGGQTEILNKTELLFSGREDAVNKICTVLQDDRLRADLCCHLAKQGNLFSAENFARDVQNYLAKYELFDAPIAV